MQKLYLAGAVTAALLLLVSGGCRSTADSSGKPAVAVSILPQRFFVRQISGERLNVLVMIPPGSSPAVYDPTPKQVRALGRARFYFRIGHIPFEKGWMARLKAHSTMKVVDTSRGVKLRGGHNHDHNRDHGNHKDAQTHKAGVDPHIWLSPTAVRIQAGHIYRTLVSGFPRYRAEFTTNYRSFLRRIRRLRHRLDRILEPCRGKAVAVYHPSWGYLLDLYGIKQLAVEMDGKSPSPSHMHTVIKEARRRGIRNVIVQQQFDSRSAQTVAAELGGQVVRLDPLSPQWVDNLTAIAKQISRICR